MLTVVGVLEVMPKGFMHGPPVHKFRHAVLGASPYNAWAISGSLVTLYENMWDQRQPLDCHYAPRP